MATPRFNTLESLVATWARDAELPERMVLRNFCDWIVVGSIPEEAIVGPDGDRIAPFEIYEARRELFPTRSEEWRVSGANTSRWFSLLQAVMITDAGVLAFCQATGTELPPHLRRRPRWPWSRIEPAEHRAPPPCPKAKEHVERLEAQRSAAGILSQMRSLVDQLLGIPSLFHIAYKPGEPVDFEWLDDRWSRYARASEAAIRLLADEALAEQLVALKGEWDDVRTSTLQSQGGS